MTIVYPPAFKKVFADIHKSAKKKGVPIELRDESRVRLADGDTGCSGFFSEDPLKLVVAMDVKFDTWMETLLHESCHMDQYFENEANPVLDRHYTQFFEWIEGKAQFNKTQIRAMIKSIIGHEMDCEKRTIAKIEKYQLPIDTNLYIKKANTYISCYYIFMEKRKFYNKIYGKGGVYKYAPDDFIDTNKLPPRKLLNAIRKRAEEIDLFGE